MWRDFSLEVKSLDEAGAFTGLASTYSNVDLLGDIVEPGAFTATLAEKGRERPLLWGHDSNQPIGLAVLMDSETGLALSGSLDLDVQAGRDAYSRLKKRIVKGLSIGFKTVKDTVKDGVRHLQQLDLYEVSLVTFPANPAAQVTSVKSALQTIRDFEHWLRDAGGYSRSEAARLASHGFKGLQMADEPDPVESELLDWLRKQVA